VGPADDGASPGRGPDDGTAADPVAVEAVLVASRALLGVVAVSLAPTLEQVSLTQFRALVLLSGLGPTRIGALAQRLGVHQSTFTRTTDRMVEAGLARRVDNPGNRREVLVEATEAGLKHVREVTRRRREEIEKVLRRMSPGDQEAVRRALEAFAAAAGEPTAEVLAVLGG
jgi:DNA-binding MarR family transcriptional regulator